ncbi:hypothetical protein P1X15_02770 [Runella sp. MFBS21]|uniref:hypothetical protein n=1 Tax=Runella sp. MFBS21 TaxID=3034018 RepID=UPI0023F76173|nr:hypothetical protein [Runella sp. MFBS21]MDF7816494.1 hypothetical protein [Runella sp. MFBS21]
MKKIVLSTMGALFMTALMLSCDQSKETGITPTNAKAQEEPLSVIDQMEKEEGIKFFKRDVTLTDENTGLKVFLRFASFDEEMLEQHLANHDFKIKTVFKEFPSKHSPSIPIKQKSSNHDISTIITEVLKKELPKGATGYSLSVTSKPLNGLNAKNAKINYSREWELISDTWPEELVISVVSGQTISYALDKKMKWYSSWTTFYESGGWYPLQGPATDTHWLDGPEAYGLSPWKVRIKVAYDSMSPMYDSKGFTANFNQY